MNIGIISKRYAKTLLLFSLENKEEDTVYREINILAKVLIESPSLLDYLKNPIVDIKEKNKLLIDIVKYNGIISQSLNKFISLVLSKSRQDLFPFINQSFIKLYCNYKKIVPSKLILSQNYDKSIIDKIKSKIEDLTQTNINFDLEVDEKIKGGFILKYGTYILDASLRKQLLGIKNKLQ